jgi:1-acyl-sn-glycerol-3-phosphate acyltransferase
MLASFVSTTQAIFHFALRKLLTFLFQAEVRGNIEVLSNSKMPIILALNHAARIDPFLLALLPLRTIAKLTPLGFPTTTNYYDLLMYRIWIAPLGAYPIPLYAISVEEFLGETISKLHSGYTVVLFPEGKIVAKDKQVSAKTGTIISAIRTGACIIPIHIEGSHSVSWGNIIRRKAKVILSIREPFVVGSENEDKETCREDAERLLNVIYGERP